MPLEPAGKPKASTYGPSTLAVHAGLPDPVDGQPFLPPPTLAAPYHLAGPSDASTYGYGRYANPSWTALEAALGELEGGEALIFGSGMAAVSAVVLTLLRDGDVLVACEDGYPGIRGLAHDHLEPRGVDVRFVPTSTEATVAAAADATLVWVESPSNPRLDVLDIPAVAEAAHAAGARLVVDNSLATVLGQRPLELGADFSVAAATKSLSGHSDVLLGYVASHLAMDELLAWRGLTGAIAGPFEAWLVHRSLATAELRLARQSQTALALAEALRERGIETFHPSFDAVAAGQMRHFGPLVCFDVGDKARAQAFLSRARLVTEATSFGGVHTTAERRARWGTDAVGEGFIRLSCGVEDTEDVLADVLAALE
jgi:cystathionine gamma-lyase